MYSKKNMNNPFFLDTFASVNHGLFYTAKEASLIFTKGISDCTGIGLFYIVNGAVQEFGMYHSYTEHAADRGQIKNALSNYDSDERCKKMAEAIKEFVINKNSDDIYIDIHFNVDCIYDERGAERAAEAVYEFINNVMKVLDKDEIPDENVRYGTGDSFYAILSDANTFTLDTDKNVDDFAQALAKIIQDKIKNDDSALSQKIMEQIIKAEQKEQTWVDACFYINNLIQAALKNSNPDIGIPQSNKKLKEQIQVYSFMLEALKGQFDDLKYKNAIGKTNEIKGRMQGIQSQCGESHTKVPTLGNSTDE